MTDRVRPQCAGECYLDELTYGLGQGRWWDWNNWGYASYSETIIDENCNTLGSGTNCQDVLQLVPSGGDCSAPTPTPTPTPTPITPINPCSSYVLYGGFTIDIQNPTFIPEQARVSIIWTKSSMNEQNQLVNDVLPCTRTVLETVRNTCGALDNWDSYATSPYYESICYKDTLYAALGVPTNPTVDYAGMIHFDANCNYTTPT